MGTASPWKDGALGAVSLTFDDGHPSQLETAIPILEAHGLRGTFYLNPRGDYVNWLKPWREAYRRGHEIGNHTVKHICSRNFGWTERGGLEDMTLDEIEADILECQRRLKEGIPELGDVSFCYPCYQNYVGEGESRQSYTPVVARHFLAARGRGEYGNDPRLVDLHYLWSHDCQRRSGAEMFGLCELAAAEGRWAILTFHGVGTGHLSVNERDFQQLCAALERHRDRIWTAPVIDVAKAVREWRETIG